MLAECPFNSYSENLRTAVWYPQNILLLEETADGLITVITVIVVIVLVRQTNDQIGSLR